MGILPDRWNEYFDKPLWPNRIAYYSLIFVVLFSIFIGTYSVITTLHPISDILSLIFHIQSPIFNQYNATELSNNGFYDNERYLLSALVQSLAAVIALVITLSLVAVQLAAQSYSPRVIDVYKKNPDMWILLGIYILTIFYGLGLIKIVGLGILGSYMEGAIFVAYFIGFFAFVCLVPYMLKTLDLLKPSTVIKLLAAEITKENILDSLKNDGKIEEKDPVQPIIDMTHGALERNDYETVRNGLTGIRDSTISMLENAIFQNDEEDNLAAHILQHVERFGTHAVKKENEDSSLSAINTLKFIGTEAVNKELSNFVEKSIVVLEVVGNKAINYKMETTARYSIVALGNIRERLFEREYGKAAVLIEDKLANLAFKAIEEELEQTARCSAEILGNIGTLLAEEKLDINVQQISRNLNDIGIKAVTNGYTIVVMEAIKSLGKIGNESVNNECETAAKVTANFLGVLGVEGAKKMYHLAVINAFEGLQTMGIEAAKLELDFAVENILDTIGNAFVQITVESPKLSENPNDFYKETIGKSTVTSLYEIWEIYYMRNDKQSAKIEDCLQSIIAVSQLQHYKQTYSHATELLEKISDIKVNDENN